MLKNTVFGICAAVAFAATTASAATLNLVGAYENITVYGNDVVPALNTEIQMITGDQKTTDNGLFLNLNGGSAEITYTFMGAEAGNTNFVAVLGDGLFANNGWFASNPGDQITSTQSSSGLLQFAFGTAAPIQALGVFFNNALAFPSSPNFAMGFSAIDDDSFFVMFDDIASGDRDFDDLVVRVDVAAVPLPAGILMLLTALMGMGALRRYQRAA